MLRGGGQPIRNLDLPDGVTLDQRKATVRLIRELNEADEADDDTAARIRSYELAFRMQTEGPAAFDLSGETKETLALYGVGAEPTDDYGRRCLLARKLIEKGVRFVQVYASGWDSHDYLARSHHARIRAIDQPITALIGDLKQLLGPACVS